MPYRLHTDPEADDGHWNHRKTSSGDDMDRWCPGSCNAGARRRVRHYEQSMATYVTEMGKWANSEIDEEPERPNTPKVTPVYADPVYCAMCGYDIKAKLSKLDGAACVYLREADGMRGQSDQAKVSGSVEKQSLSPTVEDLDELDGWLRDWKASYLGSGTSARQGLLADSITLGVAWLVARTDRLLTRPDMARLFGDEVHAWYGRLARFDPSDVVVKKMRARCDWCQGDTLEWRQGEDRVSCRRSDCGRVLKLNEYEAMEDDAKKAAAP
jgi:copper chaperone CopZ